MNKLIIVGNGFDLAHGLPTTYNNFLTWFWARFKKSYHTDEIKNIIEYNPKFEGLLGSVVELNSYSSFSKNVNSYVPVGPPKHFNRTNKKKYIEDELCYEFKNYFFLSLCIISVN